MGLWKKFYECKIKVAGFNSAKGQFQTAEFIWDKIGKECGHSTLCPYESVVYSADRRDAGPYGFRHSELRYESFFRFLGFTSE